MWILSDLTGSSGSPRFRKSLCANVAQRVENVCTGQSCSDESSNSLWLEHWLLSLASAHMRSVS